MKKVLYLIAEDSYFCTHRLNLAKAAQQAGYHVAVATRCHRYTQTIENAGIQVFPLQHFSRTGIHPWQQFLTALELYKIYRTFQPTVVHHVAMKPVILGSWIARLCKIPRIINAFGGLGYLFTEDNPDKERIRDKLKKLKKNILRRLLRPILYVISSRANTTLILQNQDDIHILVSRGYVKLEKIALIQGAGVDIAAFPETPPPTDSPVIIACVSRMLWNKGIGELVKAAEILRQQKVSAQIRLYGSPDPENPRSISIQQLEHWHTSGILHWEGHCDNVAQAYANCHIAVLPSYYREGLPKTLLEAASLGRPIVTTTVAGCREVVQPGQNGFLVPPKDPIALSKALRDLIENEPLRLQMGRQSRRMVENQFTDTFINKQTLALYTTHSI